MENETKVDRQPALHRQFIKEGLLTEEESEMVIRRWESQNGMSKCCHAPLIGGFQCEACGSDGK